MHFISKLNEINKNDVNSAGGKGASLGEMINFGIPVPTGFVILSSAFDYFLSKNNLEREIRCYLDSINHREINTVRLAAEKIQELIRFSEVPYEIECEVKKVFEDLNLSLVAVRSSATAEDGKNYAWAGQLESYLNTSSINLIDRIKDCWASLFTPRAILYMFQNSLSIDEISVAVVIQQMINSEFSGTAFSVHPVTEDDNQLIIEAGFGLGEAMVSGQVSPDSYVVDKKTGEILSLVVSRQNKKLSCSQDGGNIWVEIGETEGGQVLNCDQITKLSSLIIEIETHYGFPCDIEWAYEDDKIYILQSRPITTLGNRCG